MLKNEQREDKLNEVVQLRACLGLWGRERETIKIVERSIDSRLDGRAYEIIESRGAYKVPLKYYANIKDVLGKIKALNQLGWKLTSPQYPELSEFFRNGKPITAMDVFEDAMDEMKVAETDNRTGLDFLMDNWN